MNPRAFFYYHLYLNFFDSISQDISNNLTEWIMCVLTVVSIIISMIMCIYTHKAHKATKCQIDESKREFEEMNRARIFVDLAKLDKKLCLRIQNAGNAVACDISVYVPDEWLDSLENKFSYANKVIYSFKMLNNARFALAPGSYRMFLICIMANGGDFQNISDGEFTVAVQYESNGKRYDDSFDIRLNPIGSLLFDNEKDEKMGKTIEVLKQIKGSIEDLK